MPIAPIVGDPNSPNAGMPQPGQTSQLMAAAELMDTGPTQSASDALRSAPVPRGRNIQTGWRPRGRGRHGMGIHVVR